MLLDRKSFDDVENLDELRQAALLHKLIESDATQLFIHNQLLQLRDVCVESRDCGQKRCRVEVSAKLLKVTDDPVHVFDVVDSELGVRFLALNYHIIHTLAPSMLRSSPKLPDNMQESIDIDIIRVQICYIFSIHINILFDLLSILCKLILLLCAHALLVWYRDFLDLVLRDHAQINELLLILEKLISDPVIALVERSHEARKYPQFLGPLFCDAK